MSGDNLTEAHQRENKDKSANNMLGRVEDPQKSAIVEVWLSQVGIWILGAHLNPQLLCEEIETPGPLHRLWLKFGFAGAESYRRAPWTQVLCLWRFDRFSQWLSLSQFLKTSSIFSNRWIFCNCNWFLGFLSLIQMVVFHFTCVFGHLHCVISLFDSLLRVDRVYSSPP